MALVGVRGARLGALRDPDTRRAAQDGVTTTVGDPARLLDVHMHQVPRGRVLIP
jgi:hypothetical protein